MRENGFSYWIKWYNFKEFYVYYVRCYLTLRSLDLASFISSCLCKQLILEPFLFPTLQFKKEITLMHQQSTVKYLSEFLVCEEQNCFQSTNICHKSYFREAHFNIINNKKTTHKSVPFDQSIQYINFYNIAKIENILTQKITNSLKGFTTNLDAIVQGAIYNSELFLEIFGNSQAAIAEYLYLRSIQKGNEMGMVYAFNQVLCVSLLTNQDKKVSKCYKELCKENAEWENLNAEFNLASGINSTHLESFIQREIAYFAAYCQKLAEEKKEFNILNYISLHNSSSEYQNDIYYYNSQFTSFLTAKYEKNPEKQQIFSVGEYYLHFWEFFYLIFDANANKNVINYFEEEVSFYQEYESIMAQIGLKESFLSFRMWRLNHKVSKWKPSLKNPFFLESYIYSFIEQLIYKKLYYPEEKRSYDFKEFSKYIKDYVKFVNEKKEQFSFVRYREYFDFRKKNDNFEESLKKNKEVIYSKVYYLEYIHSEFVEGNRVALKKYKKHQETKMLQEAEKAASFRTLTENLKNTLAEEQKDRFYEIVFINYINSVQEDNENPTKENYYQYKSNVLQNFDETYLQEEEANYKQALAEQMEQVDLNSDKEKDEGKKNEIVKEEINAIEEKIAEIIEDEDRSEDSSEDYYEQAVICPCCNGKPFDCKEKECIVMGCCTACMLD